MMKRGLRAPVQVTTDGAPEPFRAVEEDFFNRLQGVAFQASAGHNSTRHTSNSIAERMKDYLLGRLVCQLHTTGIPTPFTLYHVQAHLSTPRDESVE